VKGLGTIRAENREAGAAAARANKKPFVVTEVDLQDWKDTVATGHFPRFPFPNIGDHDPEGWEQVDTLFCDHSGFGSTSEPALTIPQLVNTLEAGKGYAIVSVGQFQLHLGVYERRS